MTTRKMKVMNRILLRGLSSGTITGPAGTYPGFEFGRL